MQSEQRNEKKRKHNTQGLWDIHIMGIPEEEKRETGAEKIIDVIMAEYFPKLITETTNPGSS